MEDRWIIVPGLSAAEEEWSEWACGFLADLPTAHRPAVQSGMLMVPASAVDETLRILDSGPRTIVSPVDARPSACLRLTVRLRRAARRARL